MATATETTTTTAATATATGIATTTTAMDGGVAFGQVPSATGGNTHDKSNLEKCRQEAALPTYTTTVEPQANTHNRALFGKAPVTSIKFIKIKAV